MIFQRWFEKRRLKTIESFRSLDGWLTDREALGLYETTRKLKASALVVEIGSWQGKSTYCIAKALRRGKVYAIDPFNADAGMDTGSEKEYQEKGAHRDLLASFTRSMQSLGVMDKIVVKKGYSGDYKNEFQQIDFLFIDGDHSIPGCTADYYDYAKKIVVGGYIAFHDFYLDRPDLGPTHVITQLVLKSSQFSFYKTYDSLWVGKKIQ